MTSTAPRLPFTAPATDDRIDQVAEALGRHEDASLQARLGVPTRLAKLLVIYEEPRPGRMTVILVREPVGV